MVTKTKKQTATKKPVAKKTTNISKPKTASAKAKTVPKKVAVAKTKPAKSAPAVKPAAKKKQKSPVLTIILSLIAVAAIIAVAYIFLRRESYMIGGRKYTKIADYLYEVTYDDYEEEAATEYMLTNYPKVEAACSSVRNGNYFGRNYDWYYDESADFVLHMTATEDRHASIGIAGSLPSLTNDYVASAEDNFAYEILPLITVDGINDAGVGINVNVVPVGDAGRTTGTNPGKEDLLINNVVRFVLDNADSVDNAIELLNNRNVYVAMGTSLDMEFHFMISDPNTTKVVEFVNNEMVVLEDQNIMTNYYLSIPETEYSMGTERYKILSDNYELGNTKSGMLELMQKVNYTKAYDLTIDDFWYSEYYDPLMEIGKSNTEAVQAYVDYFQDIYSNRTRDGKTWQTVHTSVYDLKNKTLSVIVQENGKAFNFSL